MVTKVIKLSKRLKGNRLELQGYLPDFRRTQNVEKTKRALGGKLYTCSVCEVGWACGVRSAWKPTRPIWWNRVPELNIFTLNSFFILCALYCHILYTWSLLFLLWYRWTQISCRFCDNILSKIILSFWECKHVFKAQGCYSSHVLVHMPNKMKPTLHILTSHHVLNEKLLKQKILQNSTVLININWRLM